MREHTDSELRVKQWYAVTEKKQQMNMKASEWVGESGPFSVAIISVGNCIESNENIKCPICEKPMCPVKLVISIKELDDNCGAADLDCLKGILQEDEIVRIIATDRDYPLFGVTSWACRKRHGPRLSSDLGIPLRVDSGQKSQLEKMLTIITKERNDANASCRQLAQNVNDAYATIDDLRRDLFLAKQRISELLDHA